MGRVRWDSTERKGKIKKRAGRRRGRKRRGGEGNSEVRRGRGRRATWEVEGEGV